MSEAGEGEKGEDSVQGVRGKVKGAAYMELIATPTPPPDPDVPSQLRDTHTVPSPLGAPAQRLCASRALVVTL